MGCSFSDNKNNIKEAFEDLVFKNKIDNGLDDNFINKLKLFNDNIQNIKNLYELFNCLTIFESGIFEKIIPESENDCIDGYIIIRFYYNNKMNYVPIFTSWIGFFDTWGYHLTLHSNLRKRINLKIDEKRFGEIEINTNELYCINKNFRKDTFKKMKYLTKFYKFFNLVMNMYYDISKFDSKKNELVLFNNIFINQNIDVKTKYSNIVILNQLVNLKLYLEQKPIPIDVMKIIQDVINNYLLKFYTPPIINLTQPIFIYNN